MWRHNPGSAPPPPRISFPYTVKMARGGVEGWGAYCGALRLPVAGEGHWKLETVVLGRQGVVKGQLVRHGVMPITGARGWGDRMEAHKDHAWVPMRSHAERETPVHSGELAMVEVGGGGDNYGGDDDSRSHSSVGSRGSKGTGLGRPRKVHWTGPPTPFPTLPAVTPSTQVADSLQQQ